MCALCCFLHCASFIVQFTLCLYIVSTCWYSTPRLHCIMYTCTYVFFKHYIFSCQMIFRERSLHVAVMCASCFSSSLDNSPIPADSSSNSHICNFEHCVLGNSIFQCFLSVTVHEGSQCAHYTNCPVFILS